MYIGLKEREMMKIMRRIHPFVAFIAAILYISSCTKDNTVQNSLDAEQRYFDIYIGANYPDAVQQTSGLFYMENTEGSGAMPGDSTWVLVNHVAYSIPEDQVLDTYIERVAIDNRIQDTSALYGPYKMRNGLTNEGFTEGLKMMKEGGEATFMFTSELGYGSKNTGGLPAYTSLKYEVQLLEILGDDIVAYEETKILAYTNTIFGVDAIYDETSDATMFYVVDSTTDGPPVAIDSTIQVAYKGYLMDGRVFDESSDGNYFQFKVGDYDAEGGTAIEGWHLGLEKFKEGEKGRLIIPYPLAYGEFGRLTSGNKVIIPPYETLIFDVEVVSVVAAEDDDLKPDSEE
jgi:FKBP-type peptidyl-prolyl cis-trans isomerase FkpA